MKKGFTLIELLVVISIIGLLSTVAVVATSSTKSKARDTRRLADMRQIKLAVDMYVLDNGASPLCGGNNNCTTPVTSWGDFKAIAIKPNYMANIPGDPLSVAGQYGYYYVSGLKKVTDCTFAVAQSSDYFLATRLENPNAVAGSCPGGVANAGITLRSIT